jgi:membrane-associated protease RseP (regulator of RpoE activity)
MTGPRGLFLLLLLASVAAPIALPGQQTTTRRRACADCEAEVRRTKVLERLDSLQWKFENERLSDVDRDRLRKEMALAVKELQAAIGDLRVEMGDIDRAEAEVWAARPRVAFSYQRQPAGYLGVLFDGPNTDDYRNGERIIQFFAYPRISLVEPSSPAERAGIRAGDTLVSMNGVDVLEKEISLTKMLVPNQPLAVRLRRDGSARDVKVVVSAVPAYIERRWSAPTVAVAPAAPGQRVARASPGTPLPTPVPQQQAITMVWASDGVAGARVENLTPGLGRALGAETGVLVRGTGPGTPAGRAGLRDGDVIVRVAGQRVTSVRELREVLANTDAGAGVKIVIVRERKEQELTLRQ